MKILSNQSLADLNTFKIDVKGREIVFIERQEDLLELLNIRDFKSDPYYVLGEGSNILFTRDYQGIFIKILSERILKIKENKQHVWLKVDAGLNWHTFVERTLEMGYQGIENLSLIPGTVGAVPVQNIGAYGVEIKQFIEKVEALDLQGGEFFHFNNPECHFEYRSSIFKTKYKGRFIITSITFKLNVIPDFNVSYDRIREILATEYSGEVNARNISKAVIHIRRQKLPDPTKIGNAGSFFKNPVIDKTDYEGLKAEFPGINGFKVGEDQFKIPAAWLIESCGWKGKTMGQAGVYERQPLVLVNLGNAKGHEILELANKIKNDVSQKFGIILQPEVNIL